MNTTFNKLLFTNNVYMCVLLSNISRTRSNSARTNVMYGHIVENRYTSEWPRIIIGKHIDKERS